MTGVQADEAFALWMESHKYYSELWKRILVKAANMELDILAPKPAKYIAPRKSSGALDNLQINKLLHHLAKLGKSRM
ncbi:hypothetical protein ACS0TY_010707 [Phlomoides rotata]